MSEEPDVILTGGPERIYDTDAADPSWQPRFAGFRLPHKPQPLTWEGDNA